MIPVLFFHILTLTVRWVSFFAFSKSHSSHFETTLAIHSKKIFNFLSMNAMPRGKSRYYIRLKRTVMTETPSPLTYPPDTITQMTTVPILCKPVEQHRHSESCRVFSKSRDLFRKTPRPSFNGQSKPRHHFQKSEDYFEKPLDRNPDGVHHVQRTR